MRRSSHNDAQTSQVRPAAGTRPHGDRATAEKPPTSVHPMEPEDAGSLKQAGARQNDALGTNADGQGRDQAKRHPATPAGQHATGSFTGGRGRKTA